VYVGHNAIASSSEKPYVFIRGVEIGIHDNDDSHTTEGVDVKLWNKVRH
jgi:hypothetical protein